MNSLFETALQDLRYGFRSLRRSGIFSLTAVLTLALTMGAVSTVFSLADALLFRPLAAERPEGIVVVSATRRQGSQLGWVSHPDYVRFREQSQTLATLAAHYSAAPFWVTVNHSSREVGGAVVSANLFPLLGVRPVLGRFFSEEEDRVPDRDHVAVLGYELWRDSFGSSPDALGATVKINAAPFTVIGVAPPGFRGLSAYPDEIYIPTMMLRVGYRWCDVLRDDCTALGMIGRLREGRTVEQAQAEMVARMPSEWRNAREGENTGVTVFPPRGAHLRAEPEDVQTIALVGLVAGVLLLVCCANLAGLLMARGGARARELAIRVSLGAGRARLVRQLMTESFLLAGGGGLLGVLLSLGLTDVLEAAFYSTSGGGDRLSFDFRPQPMLILAVFGLSVGAAFLFGLLPALKSIAAGAAESLRRQSSTVSSPSSWIRSLVGTQAAVATALLAVAGLLAVSAHRLGQGAGFEPSRVALMRLRPRLLDYPPEKAQAYHREVIRRLMALPGVSSVSVVGTGIALLGGEANVSLPEWTDANRQRLLAGYMDIGPRYFETLRTPVRRGREFDDHDALASPSVAVVNETLAKRLWPAGNAIGEPVLVEGRPHQVVGVVADVPLENRTSAPLPYVYVPYWQNAGAVDARYCVRVEGDPATMLPGLVREANRVDPDVPITQTVTLSFQIAQGMLKPARMTATVLVYAAALAVVLSAIGLYGTLAFSVARRTKEMGIRMAIGAEAREVLALILREGMTVALTGVLAGVVLAAGGTQLVRHLLYGSAAADGVFYAGGGLLVAAVSLLACWIPARRAAGVEPVVALRDE